MTATRVFAEAAQEWKGRTRERQSTRKITNNEPTPEIAIRFILSLLIMPNTHKIPR
jgi:hypothetical protein